MKKINSFYLVQESGKSLPMAFSVLSNLGFDRKVLVFIENNKETENLVNFLNVFGFNAYGFLNDLEILKDKNSFIYFHDKSQNFDFSKIGFDSFISFFCDDSFEKIKSNKDLIEKDEIEFYEISSKFPYRTIQRIRELGFDSTEIFFEKLNEKNNFEERISNVFKEKTKNEFSPNFADLYFWCSSQPQNVLSNIICNFAKSLSLVSVESLANLSLNRFLNENSRREERESKKVYEISLSLENKENLTEEKIRSYLLLNSSIRNDDILNILISENKFKFEIETFSSKQVLKYLIENAFEGENLRIDAISTKFVERRSDFSRGNSFGNRRSFSRDNNRGSYAGGGRSDGRRFPRRDFSSSRDGSSRDGASREGGSYERSGPREGGSYERRDNRFSRPREGGEFRRRDNDFFKKDSSENSAFEGRNSFSNKPEGLEGDNGFSKPFEKRDRGGSDRFSGKRFDSRGDGRKRFDKGSRDDYGDRSKGGFKKRGFEF